MVTKLKHRAVPELLEERIDICLNGEKGIKVDTNCFGTSLFLMGMVPYDVIVFSNMFFIQRALSLMDEVSEVRDNSLIVSINRNNIHHMSYVESCDPFVGYQRIGQGEKCFKIDSISEIDSYLATLRESKLFNPFLSKELNKLKNSWEHKYYVLPDLGLISGFSHRRKLKKLSKQIVSFYRSDWKG